MKLHREGFKIIFITLLVLTLINFPLEIFFMGEWYTDSILVLSIVFFILIVQFFRDPHRQTPVGDDLIIAPADGKVVVIEEVDEPEYLKTKCRQISIFMSPVNVHVNRYPTSGKVLYEKYHPGKYLVAWHPKSSTENERTTVVVENNVFGEILYRQIAGAIARRIVNYAKVGDEVIQGTDAGFIKFGSRVDLFLPLDSKIKVELDQIVNGAEDIIAEK